MSILHLLLPLYPSISCFTSTQNLPSSPNFYVLCQMDKPSMVIKKLSHNSVVRRSANYQPPIWKHEFIQSLKSEFMKERCLNQRNMLIRRVKMMLNEELLVGDNLKGLEVVDELQRLGISYHFQMEINQILEIINERFNNGEEGLEWNNNKSLYATSLHFRILRQHGYHIPQEVFDGFKDELENMDSDICDEKAKDMLSLYEASFLSMEGESFLDELRHFVVQHLSKYLESNGDEIVCTMISHALELPLHWRMPRLEARWFIDVYRTKPNSNLVLLDLAKLDFNVVQSIHQDDLKYAARWWKSTGLAENLEFARDRLMANFFCSVGMGFEPHLGCFRRMTTKVTSLITIIDDVYDVYGTLDELELFTDVVERWDIAAIDRLPKYMRLCFITLHNTINDMAFKLLNDHEVNEEAKRGEVANSIQCYMNDTGASEQEARRYIKDLIMESWKKMNEEVQALSNSPLFCKLQKSEYTTGEAKKRVDVSALVAIVMTRA
uniref:Terpene synthase 10-like n=2 Tax=Cucumis melo TaxID=3656 RepID=A0A9I9DSX4_CUCME